MKNMWMSALSVVVLSLSTIPGAIAADLSKKIPAGGSLGDVLASWGEPTEKIEKEVKREVVWYYPEGARVTFKDGRVKSWRAPDSIRQKDAEVAAAKALVTPIGEELTAETRDLVRDIAREVPSGPDVPYVEAPQAGGISQPPQGANQANMHSRNPQAGIAPAGIDLEDEE